MTGMATDETHLAGGPENRPALSADDIISWVGSMPGVEVVTAGAATGAPAGTWGDTFFSYAPPGQHDALAERWHPFATIVTQDYAGFDTSSNLDRAGVFRLNVAVGRDAFRELVGYPPAAHAEHRTDVDHSALDVLLPHPVYASQSWVAILNPGERTGALARDLLRRAHQRAAARHRRRQTPADTGPRRPAG